MRTSVIAVLMALLSFGVYPAAGGDNAGGPTCCARCGCHAACVKSCQVVCEMTKETRTCYCVEYREFCPLMPGFHECGDHGCAPPPRCAAPRWVKKLVTKEYQVEVPVYKCVLQYLCPACAAGGQPSPVAAPRPPAPPTGAPAMPPPPAPPPPVPRRVPY